MSWPSGMVNVLISCQTLLKTRNTVWLWVLYGHTDPVPVQLGQMLAFYSKVGALLNSRRPIKITEKWAVYISATRRHIKNSKSKICLEFLSDSRLFTFGSGSPAKHENFCSRFLIPSKPIWVGYLLIERKNEFDASILCIHGENCFERMHLIFLSALWNCA